MVMPKLLPFSLGIFEFLDLLPIVPTKKVHWTGKTKLKP